MGPTMHSASRNESPPPKRALSSFFSRILPSNRPEQGGTTRITNGPRDDESSYLDLGMNPNDLTEWNLPRDRPSRPATTDAEGMFRRGRSASRHHHKDSNGYDKRPRRRSQRPERSPRPPSLNLVDIFRGRTPSTSPGLSKSHTRTKIGLSDALKTKEDARRRRRSLKESGDWLGVQGADPYSGRHIVLTPTDTVSSDMTTPSAKSRLRSLSRKKKAAKLAYDQALLEEETEREKNVVLKERSKLEKMERAKAELRQQSDQMAKWSQHKRQWSSAAEPNLSPIAQSLNSYKLTTSSDEVAPVAVPNFSRPEKGRSRTGSVTSHSSPQVSLVGDSENAEPPKHSRNRNYSTDTIIRKSTPYKEFLPILEPEGQLHRPALGPGQNDAPTPPQPQKQEKKSEKHFLWRRRRRMTDPGKDRGQILQALKSSAAVTDESLVSGSEEVPPIPALPPLHFQGTSVDLFSDLSLSEGRRRLHYEGSQSHHAPTTPTRSLKRPGLTITTNFQSPKDQHEVERQSSDTAATAISSLWRSKGNTKQQYNPKRLVPERGLSHRGKDTLEQIPFLDSDPNQGRIDGNTDFQKGHQRLYFTGKARSKSLGRARRWSRDKDKAKKTSDEVKQFVFTRTTTITGFEPGSPSRIDGAMSRTRDIDRLSGTTTVVDSTGNITSPSTHSQQSGNGKHLPEGVADSGVETEGSTTSSRPATPSSALPSLGQDLEMIGRDGVLRHDLVMNEPMDQDLVPQGLKLKEKKGVRESKSLEDALMKARNVRDKYDRDIGVAARDSVPTLFDETILLREKTTVKQGTCGQVDVKSPGEHKQAMIQEAARIAMLRSRAKEVVTTRSPSLREGEQTPPESVSVLPRLANLLPGAWSSDTEVQEKGLGERVVNRSGRKLWLVTRGMAEKLDYQHDLSGQDETDDHKHVDKYDYSHDDKHIKNPDAVMTLLILLTGGLALGYGLLRMWWEFVKPVFDKESELWKRRETQSSTWSDMGVFLAAGLFLGVGVGVLGCGVCGLGWEGGFESLMSFCK
ncbi:hypothetical protein GGR57DRAFT_499959 [Xylariaceae sp. FL1272]|nr:hypothetical protein GGR57DRAFT_499959 [Xylariaceae sp. FL1272]